MDASWLLVILVAVDTVSQNLHEQNQDMQNHRLEVDHIFGSDPRPQSRSGTTSSSDGKGRGRKRSRCAASASVTP